MVRVLTISAVALFAIMLVVGETVAQERPVLQEGFQSSGTAGGVTDAYMRTLLAKPETIYGRLWGKDIPGGKIYVETGGGALVTVRLGPKTNMQTLNAVDIGNDVEVQAMRNYRRLGTGAFSSDVPEGDAFLVDLSIIRAAVTPTQLVPQAGYEPDTDRGIRSRDASDMGGVGGTCWNCYAPDVSGYGTDYEEKKKK